MSILNNLDPSPLWIYFEEICSIPRLSKNEARIRKYLIDFAIQNGLEYKEDRTGNVLVVKPASQGFEKRKTIVLQSHMDMVGEKNADHSHNWETDPIVPYINEGWVCATGTTLGADDGIGIASQLAILSDHDLKAGKIECLFTVDEESGMTGAINLQTDFFSGKTLINLDSEDEGILFIGCAGGMDTIGTISYTPVKISNEMDTFELSLTGLHGGHSGDEIHKGYGNSVKLMTRLLLYLSDLYDISISSFNAGNLRNAIPREAFAVITLKKDLSGELIKSVGKFLFNLQIEYSDIEPDIKISVKPSNTPHTVMEKENQTNLLKALHECPHGVISWSKDMEDLVETSTNLASIRFLENSIISIVTTQRSSVECSKHEAAEMVEKSLMIAGAKIVHSDGYPGWKPNISSDILKITRSAYQKLFGNVPAIRAIHAGLECGLIYEKNKMIDMISFGPTIRGAHTPEEMININSIRKFWDLLTEVIRNISENQES